eukprot:TRINITY_DN3592_c0_g1_i1.p1 TRINITY_DN3592_c0_g1~~TRINITY_DN3592_c0_g1_i1.p1  ORF type:complete len:178 (-),score=7.13 TRINITY_DN3592_c0_g1_i1:864-1397(-)
MYSQQTSHKNSYSRGVLNSNWSTDQSSARITGLNEKFAAATTAQSNFKDHTFAMQDVHQSPYHYTSSGVKACLVQAHVTPEETYQTVRGTSIEKTADMFFDSPEAAQPRFPLQSRASSRDDSQSDSYANRSQSAYGFRASKTHTITGQLDSPMARIGLRTSSSPTRSPLPHIGSSKA